MVFSWTWRDGWLLMSLVLASEDGTADLVDIVGAADCLNHAIPTNDELNQSLTRFRRCGLLTSELSPFVLDPALYGEIKEVVAKTSGLFNLPDAGKKWLEEKNFPRLNDGEVKIAAEELEAAYEAYVRKLRKR